MSEEMKIPKSLLEQTIEITLAELEKHEEFDEHTVRLLRESSSHGRLPKQQIIKAIKEGSEVKP